MTTASTHPVAGAADPDLVPGELVGEYQVESKLGHGGFGDVFKASHPLIGKEVAIKVLARRYSVDPEMLERFQAEARAVNQIRHRNIIDIFSFGQLTDGRAYYVMEYLEGETLSARLDRDGRMPLNLAVPILRSIARALDAAHACGIAHRDLKPENVFLASDPDGEVYPKLLDFGIAKLMRRDDALKSKTRTGVPIGTPHYMSPEQCRGKDVDHRTDYYAFGVVAYQLITGIVPLDGDDYMTILMKQINDEPAPASSVCALPPGIDDVIAWLMRKDPAERPTSLALAVHALEAAAGMMPKRTTPTGVPVPTPPPSTIPPFDTGSLSERGHTARAFAVTGVADPSTNSSRVIAAPAAISNHTLPPVHPTAPRSRTWLAVGVGAVVVAAAVAGWLMFAGNDGPRPEPRRPVTYIAPPQPATAPGDPATAAIAPNPSTAADPGTTTRPASDVIYEITGVPAGTRIHDASGFTFEPPRIKLARSDTPITLTFEAPGYQTVTRQVTPSVDGKLDVRLQAVPHPVTQRHPTQPAQNGRDSVEIPTEFGGH